MLKVHVVPNFISNSDCDKIIKTLTDMKKNEKLEKRGPLKQRLMRSNIPQIQDIVKSYGIKTIGTVKSLYNLENELFLSDYGVFISESGYDMNYHIDTENSNNSFTHLEYSAVIYLNNDFEGGEVHFPNIDFLYKPKAGDAIFFPANDLEYLHGVKSITDGQRFTMIFWHSGNKDEKVFFEGESMLKDKDNNDSNKG